MAESAVRIQCNVLAMAAGIYKVDRVAGTAIAGSRIVPDRRSIGVGGCRSTVEGLTGTVAVVGRTRAKQTAGVAGEILEVRTAIGTGHLAEVDVTADITGTGCMLEGTGWFG